MSLHIQDIIHKLEEGPWARYIIWLLATGSALAVALLFDFLAYRSFSNVESMDAAQLARNIAQGRGYTTYVIRPFSVFLLRQHQAGARMDLRDPQPDLTNPPVYPCLLAGLMKIAPMRYSVAGVTFSRYTPELIIMAMNQILFLVVGFLVFKWAQRLFDRAVAWVSIMVLFGSGLLWKFTVSGLSTIVLLFIFMLLAWCLAILEKAGREEQPPKKWRIPLAALVGVIMGVGTLTRYSFGWLLIPVLFFLAVFCGRQRVYTTLAAMTAFGIVLAPWMARNYSLTGKPFGTAPFSVMATTQHFPADTLERSLRPDLSQPTLTHYLRKFSTNMKTIVQNDLPKFGGSWVSAFFLAGLIVPFNNLTLGRFRFFLLLCLLVLIVAQAFGQTHLASEVPDVNSENLLVILAPLVFIYGVSFYFVLLEQITIPFPQLRYSVTGIFVAVLSLPLVLTLLPPKPPMHAYPPYWPPIIQDISGWMKGKEMMMSDIPWGIAWYGQRPCIWLTASYKPDFYEINDFLSPISAWYVTRRTIDKSFYSEWIKGADNGWEKNFLLQTLTRREVPTEFPLRVTPGNLWPEQLYLTDSPRRYMRPGL